MNDRNIPSIDFFSTRDFNALIDSKSNYDEKIFAAASWYARAGIMIVPFTKSGYPSGLSQHHATTKIAKIEEWWHPETGKYKGATIAMVHGGRSGLCAIDLDVKGDVNGINKLIDLCAIYDGLNFSVNTLMATTPSGGRHLIFKYHPEILTNANVKYPGIDTRGGLKKEPYECGGVTFAAPSKSIKEGIDGEYRWDEGCDRIADVPQWLVDVLNNRQPPMSSVCLQDKYEQSAPGKHGEGRDRNIYMDLLSFAATGYTEEQLYDLVPDILSRMYPPDEDMVLKKIESVLASDVYISAQENKKITSQTYSQLKLDRNDKGAIVKTLTNLSKILKSEIFSYEFGYIEYDQFSHKFVKDKVNMDSISNWAVAIQLWVSEKFGLEYPTQVIRDITEHLAYSERPHTNVARHYMLSCPIPENKGIENFWGSGRRGPGENFYRLCYEVLDLKNSHLHPEYNDRAREAYEAFLWFWLQGVVLRACIPGCKMEIVLNIFGDQGIGKSLFFRELCPDSSWFTDSIQDSIAGGGQNNRDELLKLHAKMIVEMPELSPIKRGGKSSDNKMKHFISSQVDNFRRAYGHDSVDHPRTCALCGTSNDNDVYRDTTGARRFVSINHSSVPIRVGDKDNGVMAQIRDKMWGEVVSSFGEGELDKNRDSVTVAIPSLLRNMQKDINLSHRFEEVGIFEIVEWMEDKTRVTWLEIIAFSKTVAGLRDARESTIMNLVRKELLHRNTFLLKSGITVTNAEGETERVSRAWVNTSLDIEKNHKAGQSVPPHWSTYTRRKEEKY